RAWQTRRLASWSNTEGEGEKERRSAYLSSVGDELVFGLRRLVNQSVLRAQSFGEQPARVEQLHPGFLFFGDGQESNSLAFADCLLEVFVDLLEALLSGSAQSDGLDNQGVELVEIRPARHWRATSHQDRPSLRPRPRQFEPVSASARRPPTCC